MACYVKIVIGYSVAFLGIDKGGVLNMCACADHEQ